jgi:adenine-specific DNA-methyltransferase
MEFGGSVQVSVRNFSARELLTLARKIATKISAADLSHQERLRICKSLLTDRPSPSVPKDLTEKFNRLEINEKHFWVGTFYTLLLPEAVRRAQATYFTPPYLAQGLVRILCDAGFDLRKHTAIDPAAGGAAFLSTIAAQMRAAGATPANIIKRIRGFEIDAGLAKLSEALIADQIDTIVSAGSIVSVRNSLRTQAKTTYDLVVANPPFGRVPLAELPRAQWERVCYSGHINKYAVFADLCIRLARPGGLVGLVLPSSFMAGPLYDRLRVFLRQHAEILTLGSVMNRKDVFVDACQDVSVLVARVGTTHQTKRAVAFGRFQGFRPFRITSASQLPGDSGRPWVAPAHNTGLTVGGASLADYGAILRTGYFVWNREQERMSKKRGGKLVVPLIWAENIKPDGFCKPAARRRRGMDFVRFSEESPGIIRSQALVMQRTTNNTQTRRLVAGRVAPLILKKFGGFVTENHTIAITAPDVPTLKLVRLLLNSEAVDHRYRLVSGTASVSVNLLRELDLPTPTALRLAVERLGFTNEAVQQAYCNSVPDKRLATA